MSTKAEARTEVALRTGPLRHPEWTDPALMPAQVAGTAPLTSVTVRDLS
jgi:hypothetical protein